MIETVNFEDGGKLEIVQDEFAQSPRSEFDHVCTMVCFHSGYDLGDKDHGYNKNDYNNWTELKEGILENENVALILPLYLYDHSGLTISTEPFQCQWDSGQIGWIFITKEKLAEFGKDLKTEDGVKILEEEVKEYDYYLRGDVYGYILTEPVEKCDKCGHIKVETDSCYGFYGTNIFENGMIDNIPEKYHEELRKHYPEFVNAV